MRKNFDTNLLIASTILVASLIISFTIVVQAQTTGEPSDEEIIAAGITFPIAELGNCASKDACRDYCNVPGNMPACIKFAKDRGLMNDDEAKRADEFRQKLERGAGPGGCRSPQECESFCSNITNIETCVKFAEEQGFKDQHVEEGSKILSYIKAGGQMPGGCNSKEACEKYCGDFSHAEECFNFAEKAGLTQVRGEVPGRAEGRFEGGIPPGQFQKFLEAIKRGETPGGCKSKDECEAYCSDSSRFEECVSFAEKAGFIEPDQVEKIRKTGGKGPGGCNSPESCRNYCNDSTHQEECFKFAEEHGLISKEELKHAKEGFIRLRQGLEHAPPEVAECLKSVLGPNIIEDIESGKLTPGPEIGERVKGCFEKFGERGDPNEVFKNAPPQVLSCLREKLGDAFEAVRSGKAQPTPEMADTFRVCFQQVQFEGGPVGFPGRKEGGPPPGFQNFVRTAPPEVAQCLKEKLGDDFEKIQSGELQATREIGEKLKACFKEFRPPEHQFNPERREFEKRFEGEGKPGEGTTPSFRERPSVLEGLPSQVVECVRSSVGEEVFEKFKSGGFPGGELKDKIQACLEKFQNVKPTPPPTSYQTKDGCPGPAPLAPNYQCPDGGVAGPVCERDASGGYHWALRKCPTSEPPADKTQPPSDTQVCIQVITPAQDPVTGVCKEFSTPCDVPAGWTHGCSKPSTETQPPASGLAPVQFLGNLLQGIGNLLSIE